MSADFVIFDVIGLVHLVACALLFYFTRNTHVLGAVLLLLLQLGGIETLMIKISLGAPFRLYKYQTLEIAVPLTFFLQADWLKAKPIKFHGKKYNGLKIYALAFRSPLSSVLLFYGASLSIGLCLAYFLRTPTSILLSLLLCITASAMSYQALSHPRTEIR